ncbi:MAG: energy transducer TonB [Lutibacter sp.]|jgi:hypothetical protein
MKKIIFLLLLSIPFLINGQSVKKVKNELPDKSVEIFYVSKSDDSTKQGSYELLKNGKLMTSGNYLNNEKDGKWLIYHINSAKSAEGNYEKGKRIGLWKFYNNKNELIQIYDFEKSILTNEGPLKNENDLGVGNGKYKELLFTDKPPTFENGNIGILNFTEKNFRYSELRKETKARGKIYVGAILLENGQLIDIKILRGIDEILDNEAIRVTKLMNGKWAPAEFEGEKVAKKIAIPFNIE